MKAILTVLFIVTKCFLHRRNQMDCLNIRYSSINAAAFSKIRKDLYTPRHMSSPALTRHIVLITGDAILFQKANRQVTGELISKSITAGKLDEVLPSCSISIP